MTSTPLVGHQGVDQRDRRLLDDLDAAVGRPRRDRRIAMTRTASALTVLREAGAVDTMTALRVISAEQHLEVDGRDRVGRRREREDDAGGPGDLDDLRCSYRCAGSRSRGPCSVSQMPVEQAMFLRCLCSATPKPVSGDGIVAEPLGMRGSRLGGRPGDRAARSRCRSGRRHVLPSRPRSTMARPRGTPAGASVDLRHRHARSSPAPLHAADILVRLADRDLHAVEHLLARAPASAGCPA